MKKINPLVFFTCMLLAQLTTFAQPFNANVLFGSENRTLSGFVPTNYDSTQQYQLLIALHGLGDNGTNYRNALVNSLGWASVFAKTIIICPDGGADAGKDFYEPAGDEQIIEAAIKYATSNYNIDTQSILLQGFSLGGRSALKYGLEHYTRFKGLILNTPAMQGLLDVRNDKESSLVYPYQHGALLPIFITCGSKDEIYVMQIEALVNELKINNADVKYNLVQNLGHTIPNASFMQQAPIFINKTNRPAFDVELFNLDNTIQYCNTNITKSVWVRNNGDSTINTIAIKAVAGSKTTNYVWNGKLSKNQHAKIAVPLEIEMGLQTLMVSAALVNQINDLDSSNNAKSSTIQLENAKNLATVMQDFDDGDLPFFVKNNNNVLGWYKDDEVSKSGKSSLCIFSTPYLFNTKNLAEEFTLPAVNVAALQQQKLYFDLAFNYLKFGPPFASVETILSDTLEVLASVDCGVTFQSIFKKGGMELATAPNPILNPGNFGQSLFIPKDDEWRTETIDLGSFAQQQNVIFAFRNISGIGGTLNIDNISFGSAYVAIKEETLINQHTSFFYPNPATTQIQLSIPIEEETFLLVTDLLGKEIKRTWLNAGLPNIDIRDLPAGVYLIQLQQRNTMYTQKLMVN